jgi:hypothetical protein
VPVVDVIISQINGIKNKTFPWYYSDMVPYGKNRKSITYTVIDPAQRNYEITSTFSATTLSNKAVLVYLDRVQLIYGIDYTFLIDAPGIKPYYKEFTAGNNDKVNEQGQLEPEGTIGQYNWLYWSTYYKVISPQEGIIAAVLEADQLNKFNQ